MEEFLILECGEQEEKVVDLKLPSQRISTYVTMPSPVGIIKFVVRNNFF